MNSRAMLQRVLGHPLAVVSRGHGNHQVQDGQVDVRYFSGREFDFGSGTEQMGKEARRALAEIIEAQKRETGEDWYWEICEKDWLCFRRR